MNLRLFITQLLLLLPVAAFSQTSDIESVFWRNYVVGLEKSLGIADLDTAARSNCLRLWANGRVIEIWNEGKREKGYLINWAKEAAPFTEEEPGRYFCIKEALDSAQCAAIARSASLHSIRALPDGNTIPGWSMGFDGIEYVIESKQHSQYSLKSYWTPTAQDGLKEAELIQGFVDDALRIVDAVNRRKYFQMSIPFNSWTTDGGVIVSRIMTQQEHWRMKRERNKYLRRKQR